MLFMRIATEFCGSITANNSIMKMNTYATLARYCPNCGGDIIGDGYTTVLHCEQADEDEVMDADPDSQLICCKPDQEEVTDDDCDPSAALSLPLSLSYACALVSLIGVWIVSVTMLIIVLSVVNTLYRWISGT